MKDPDATRGLYSKFHIERTDPGSAMRHPDCRYFVLDVDHDAFASAALRAYADASREQFPFLAEDIDRMLASTE